MELNLSPEMIEVIYQSLRRLNNYQLDSIQVDDGHGYTVNAFDALALFEEIRTK